MLKRKFSKCSDKVKIMLFKSFCTQLYTCTLWSSYKTKTIESFYIAYNQALRILMGIPYFCSAKQMFVYLGIYSVKELIRKSVYSFKKRVISTPNDIIQGILNSDCTVRSQLWQTWTTTLFVRQLSV
jgi:hypothetical protein